MCVLSAFQSHIQTDTNMSTLKSSLCFSSLSHPYLELGLTAMAGTWEGGLPASGRLVPSLPAEEMEISPVHKHCEITCQKGLINACI